jgi:hypothetical protein
MAYGQVRRDKHQKEGNIFNFIRPALRARPHVKKFKRGNHHTRFRSPRRLCWAQLGGEESVNHLPTPTPTGGRHSRHASSACAQTLRSSDIGRRRWPGYAGVQRQAGLSKAALFSSPENRTVIPKKAFITDLRARRNHPHDHGPTCGMEPRAKQTEISLAIASDLHANSECLNRRGQRRTRTTVTALPKRSALLSLNFGRHREAQAKD